MDQSVLTAQCRRTTASPWCTIHSTTMRWPRCKIIIRHQAIIHHPLHTTRHRRLLMVLQHLLTMLRRHPIVLQPTLKWRLPLLRCTLRLLQLHIIHLKPFWLLQHILPLLQVLKVLSFTLIRVLYFSAVLISVFNVSISSYVRSVIKYIARDRTWRIALFTYLKKGRDCPITITDIEAPDRLLILWHYWSVVIWVEKLRY